MIPLSDEEDQMKDVVSVSTTFRQDAATSVSGVTIVTK
jgi:hypothetical protein